MLGAVVQLCRRLMARLRRPALERELDEELQFHREMLERDFEHGGMSGADAHDAARRKLGNSLSLRERSADAWSFPAIETVGQDVRYAARMLRRSPAFTLVAVCAVGLAIGVNCGFFTVVDAMVWQPLPVSNPKTLVRFFAIDEGATWNNLFSFADYRDLSASARSMNGIVAFSWRFMSMAPAGHASTGPTAPIATSCACVSGNYFTVLGGAAQLGRGLIASDAAEGAAPVIVLGDRFWRSRFAASSDVVGRDVLVNGVHATIVGVGARDFMGTQPRFPDFWMPITTAARLGATPGDLAARENRFLQLHGRVRAGVSRSQAVGEMSGIVREPARAKAIRNAPRRLVGVGLRSQESLLPLDAQSSMLAAPGFFAVLLVLVIACANLANLLLARAIVRQREIAVRMAVGASRARLLRQLLTESLVIAVLGAALGYLLANVSVTAITRALFAAFPPEAGTVVLNLHPSWRVLSFTVLLALISVLVFGLAPALQGTSLDVAAQLKGDDRAFGSRLRRSRFRDWLVTAQVAACLVLTVAAGILVQSVRHMLNTQTGVDPSHVVVARLGLSTDGRIPPKLAEARAKFAARVAALPGVASSARVTEVPFDGRLRAMQVQERGEVKILRADVVTPEYFAVVRQRLLRGRLFTAADTGAASDVAVVTMSTAKMLWPGRDAIGQQLHSLADHQDAAQRIYEVIGVVADARTGWLWDEDDGAYAYLPASAQRMTSAEMPLLIRSDGSPADVTAALARVALDVDPTAPLRVVPLTDYLGVQLLPFEYVTKVAIGIGAIGLLLSTVGLYGVVAFAVRQRTHEVAVHIAMGAGRGDVLRLVLRRELRLVTVGLVIGLVLASGEAKLIGSIQVPLTPLGPVGFVLLLLLLLLVAVAASVVPAMRALRVDPMRVLRQE